MATVDLKDIIVMDGSASSILVGEDIVTGDIICKPNIPGPALAYKANATADAGRYEVIGISVTTTDAGGQCFYVRRGAVVKCGTINNTGNDTTYWLSTTDGKMGSYDDFDDKDHVYMLAEAYNLKKQVKLTMVDFKTRKETPLPSGTERPEKPTLSGTTTIDSIELLWTEPTSESKIYAYILKRGNSTLYEGPLKTYMDDNLLDATEYTYKIAAISNNGTSEYDEVTLRTLPKPTSIGTITIEGVDSVAAGDVAIYTALNAGDAGNRSYDWDVEGGTGASTTASCEVTWGIAGSGKVTCTISSSDEDPQDSPQSGELEVTIIE